MTPEPQKPSQGPELADVACYADRPLFRPRLDDASIAVGTLDKAIVSLGIMLRATRAPSDVIEAFEDGDLDYVLHRVTEKFSPHNA